MPPETKKNGGVVLVRGVIGLLILQSTILIAGIPWAMSIHGNVCSISTRVDNLAPLTDRYMALAERVKACEVRYEEFSKHQNTGNPLDVLPSRK